MKFNFLLVLLLLFQLGRAQTPTESGVGDQYRLFSFQLGVKHLRVLDRNVSGLVHTGYLPTFSIGYEGLKNNNRIQGNLQLARGGFYAESFPNRSLIFKTEDIYGNIDSVTVPMRGTNTLAGLSLAYSRRVHFGDQMGLDLGAVLADDLYYPQGFVQPGLMNVASLSPKVDLTYAPQMQHVFSIGISVPLLTLVSRSTYNNSVSQPHDARAIAFFDQGTRWSSLESHRQIDLRLAYQWRMGSHLSSSVRYHFRMLKNDLPRSLSLRQNELALGIQIIR